MDAGVLEVLHLHLDHGSQKLVHDLLRCIRDLSDVATRQNAKNVTPILAKAMQLMGSSDLNVKLMCTSILLNLLANNAPNKEFACRNQVIPALRDVLDQTEMLMVNPHLHQPSDGAILEEIQVRNAVRKVGSTERSSYWDLEPNSVPIPKRSFASVQ